MDKFEELFRMQTDFNDRVFIKRNIRDHTGKILSMKALRSHANAGNVGATNSVNQWLTNYLVALNDESRELGEELQWKWWAKDTLNMQNIRVEIIDQLHFWISLAIAAGLDAHSAFDIYAQKNKVNHERQDKGYTLATKTEDDNKTIQT